MAKETAEQKLLKMIESTDAAEGGGGEGGAEYAEQVAKSVKGGGMTLAVPSIVESILGKFKAGSGEKSEIKFGMRELNLAFMALSVILAFFFVIDIMRGISYSNKELSFKMPKQIAEMPRNLMPQFALVGDYINIVTRRNIFQPFEKKEVQEALADVPPETRKIMQQTQDLKLVGVSWLDSAETATALIENTASGVTHFLRAGDQVNEVTIKEIYADSVVVGYGSEELNLNL